MKISEFSIRHPAIVTIISIAVIVFGTMAALKLPQEHLPDVEMPTLLVATRYPGAGPEEVEKKVTDVLEKELGSLAGIDNMTSRSSRNVSLIVLEFTWDSDIDRKLPELRERITAVLGDLPADIPAPPSILRYSSNRLPVMTIVAHGATDAVRATRLIEDELVPALSRIGGVAGVDLAGTAGREVLVSLDLAALMSRAVDPLQVVQALKAACVTLPAGSVEYQGANISLRTAGEFTSLEQVGSVVVGAAGTVPVRLSDVAHITLGEKKPDVYTLQAGLPVIVLDVSKRQGTDALTIIDRANRVLREFEARHDDGLRFEVLSDQGRDIRLSIRSVSVSAIYGGVLAVGILFLFLRSAASTLIITLSIPLSVFITFMALYARGQSINIATLGGLTVSLGMIVDSSIVILENIFRHHKNGDNPHAAAALGATEVGGAVLASITTSLAVFAPLLFVGGFTGIVLRDISMTIVYALLGSLLAALVIVPFLSHVLLSRGGKLSVRAGTGSGKPGIFTRIGAHYRTTLGTALDHTGLVILTGFVLLALSVVLFFFVGFDFIPQSDNSEVTISVRTPPGYTLERTREKMVQIEELVRTAVPEIDKAVFYAGQGSSFSTVRVPNAGFAFLKLVGVEQRKRSAFDIIDALRLELNSRIVDAEIYVENSGITQQALMAAGGSGFQIEVSGNDIGLVHESAEMAAALMRQDPAVAEVSLNVTQDFRQLTERFDVGMMGRLGVVAAQAATTARIAFNGMEAGNFRLPDGTTIPITVGTRYLREPIPSDIRHRLAVRSQAGKPVAFSAFSRNDLEMGLNTIPHENRQKAIRVIASLSGANIREVQSRMVRAMQSLCFPPGVQWHLRGVSQQIGETFGTLALAVLGAVFLVYVVMVVRFERFRQPLIVLASVPFTFIGVIAALLLFGSTLSIISFLGIIALAGIVVNNAIVMIDYMNHLRDRQGYGLREAIVEGASVRLRPILMTTLTTVLGLVPLALGMGEGSDILASLGQAIAGGLITSTLVTLFLVPSLYFLVERAVARRRPVQ